METRPSPVSPGTAGARLLSLCPVPPSGGQSALWRIRAGRRVGRSDHDPALAGQSGVVLGGLKRKQAQSDEAAKAIANCWDYLYEHRGRTHYRHLRRGGYALGSGGIESSNKFICHVRLKRSGAWWYEVNSNQ